MTAARRPGATGRRSAARAAADPSSGTAGTRTDRDARVAVGPFMEIDITDTDIRLRLARTQPRSTDMYATQHAMNEQFARQRWHELSTEARRSRLVRAVRAARRARRAEQTAQRAAQHARNAGQAARAAAQQLV